MTYDNITATLVLHNEEPRAERLLATLRPHFATMIVGVQRSTDRTREIAAAFADVVVDDELHGFGDATFGPRVLPRVVTEWSFKVDGDEMPTDTLLANLGGAVAVAEAERRDGVWVPFRSWVDDIEWTEHHEHLRLFRTKIGWPGTLHSRPMTDNTNHLSMDQGWIEHRKSLDEHVRGYLIYLAKSGDHAGWINHNKDMIWHACAGTAEVKGWDYVKAHPWWPEVEAVVFASRNHQVPTP